MLQGTTPHDLAKDGDDKKVMGLREPVPCQNRVQYVRRFSCSLFLCL